MRRESAVDAGSSRLSRWAAISAPASNISMPEKPYSAAVSHSSRNDGQLIFSVENANFISFFLVNYLIQSVDICPDAGADDTPLPE